MQVELNMLFHPAKIFQKRHKKYSPVSRNKYDRISKLKQMNAFKSTGTTFVVSIVSMDILSANQRELKSHPDSAPDAVFCSDSIMNGVSYLCSASSPTSNQSVAWYQTNFAVIFCLAKILCLIRNQFPTPLICSLITSNTL